MDAKEEKRRERDGKGERRELDSIKCYI